MYIKKLCGVDLLRRYLPAKMPFILLDRSVILQNYGLQDCLDEWMPLFCHCCGFCFECLHNVIYIFRQSCWVHKSDNFSFFSQINRTQ